jgi:cellulose synthase/poly-beta-1,6-N-acetylglucosamine synthase-like glycosyltransferase
VVLQIIFWAFLLIIFYSYLGYGMVLWFLIKLKRALKGKPTVPELTLYPEVTLLIAAYNEADFIPEKVANCLALEYPKDKLTIVFVTDGSNDGSPEILKQWPEIKVLHQNARAGKIGAMNRGMEFVKTPITIFCDANTILTPKSVINMVRHFNLPTTGCVAGEKQIIQESTEKASGAGEGIYWKYESTLKRWDSELCTVVGAAGELFALRTNLFEAVEADTLLDDFMISMRIAAKGYKVVYEPEAIALEKPTADIKEEFKRKVRICAGGIQSILRLLPLLNVLKYGTMSFQYISHRVLRWSATPLFLLLIIPINLLLALYEYKNSGPGIYTFLFIGQGLFYALSLLGWYFANRSIKVKILFVPYYFFIMNLCVFLGLARFLRGKQSVLWEKAKRA